MRNLALFSLALLAALASAQTVTTKTLKNSKKGQWTAQVKYHRFGGNTAVTRLANTTLESRARNGLAGFLKDAKEFRKDDPRGSDVPEYYYDLSPSLEVCLPNLIAEYCTVETYMGGAHGSHWFEIHNIGMAGGRARELKLRDLFRKGVDAHSIMSDLVMAKLKKIERADWVQSGEKKALSKAEAETFVITKKGLLYLFAPYEMGSYASGAITVDVPWKEFRKHLDPNGPLKGLL